MVISPEATVSPASNTPQNFTNPVTYTVSAKDGSLQSYKVTVNVLAKNTEKSNNNFGLIGLISAGIIIIVAAAITGVVLFLRKKRLSKQQI